MSLIARSKRSKQFAEHLISQIYVIMIEAYVSYVIMFLLDLLLGNK